jgi:hypothetical protein
MFAQVLVQRPLGQIGRRLLGMKKDLSKKDLDLLRKDMEENFERAVATVKAMPKSLFLVQRNVNLVRTICIVHGNPIDRYTLFSRIAAKAAIADPLGVVISPTIHGRVGALLDFALFEWNLLIYSIKSKFLFLMVSMMRYLGLMPAFPDNSKRDVGQKP